MRTPFDNLFEQRSSIGSLENPSVTLAQALGAIPTSAGVTVNEETALTVPTVFACIQVISQDFAATPAHFRRRREDGSFEDQPDHPMWELLNDLANPETTAYEFKRQMQFNLLQRSRAYAEIQRDARGFPVGFWVLEPHRMKVDRDGLNRKRYRYQLADGSTQEWIFNPDRPPILELACESPLKRCRDLIGLALALQAYSAKFFANGARLSGVLEAPRGLSENARKNLRESFSAFYQGVMNAHKVAVLEDDVKFKGISQQNDQAQLLELTKYVRTELAGVWRTPPHKIGDNERSTFSNIEHASIEYVFDALDPNYKAWEQALRRDCLTTRQYRGFEVRFDRESQIRADIQATYAALATARQNGWESTNTILRRLGKNPIPAEQGGDAYLVNGNMIPILEAKGQSPTIQVTPTDKPVAK